MVISDEAMDKPHAIIGDVKGIIISIYECYKERVADFLLGKNERDRDRVKQIIDDECTFQNAYDAKKAGNQWVAQHARRCIRERFAMYVDEYDIDKINFLTAATIVDVDIGHFEYALRDYKSHDHETSWQSLIPGWRVVVLDRVLYLIRSHI